MQFHTILIPTDCSGSAEAGVQQALAFAAREQAHVLLLHVLPSPFVQGTEGPLQAYAEHWLQTVARHAGVPVQTLVVWGTPGGEICRVATDHHCDLIAMDTHGYTGVLLDRIGSVADYVIRQVPCPVIILRTSRAGLGQVGP